MAETPTKPKEVVEKPKPKEKPKEKPKAGMVDNFLGLWWIKNDSE